MSKIVRTPTKATGGITAAEREQMRAHSDMWIRRAMRTDPIEPEKIIPSNRDFWRSTAIDDLRTACTTLGYDMVKRDD